MGRFCDDRSLAAGTGFGFSIAALQELVGVEPTAVGPSSPWLVAVSKQEFLPEALARMADLHAQAEAAELCSQPCANEEEARQRAEERGCRGAIWLG